MTDFVDLLDPSDNGPVLFVTNDFPPQHGGIQTYVRRLCDELPSERVVVHAPAHTGATDHDVGLPFTVVRDPVSTLLPTPGLVTRVRDTAQRYGARQVVYGASVPLGLMARALRRSGVRHQVALTHGHEVWWAALPLTRQAFRRVTDDVDVVTYVSEYTRRRMSIALSPAGLGKMVHLVPAVGPDFQPGIDGAPVRRALGIPSNAPVAICVARLIRRKGQDTLISIWPELLELLPDAHLILVGDGPDAARLRRMVDRRGITSRVHVLGAVASTSPYYAAADVFVMPVRNRFLGLEVEGLGLSYLEAAACGLKVLGSTSGGAPEAVNR